jgi:dienelactone hydrolase
MIASLFDAWERRLASVDTDRVVRPFEWGFDWLGVRPDADPLDALTTWADAAVEQSPSFFSAPPGDTYERSGDELRFPSAVVTPFATNNTVFARVFEPARPEPRHPRRAVVVLPQWNADRHGHVGLCQLLARFGLTAVRLSLPYHDVRRPADLTRAEHIVSSNIGLTLHANRQAVLDARRVVDWLTGQGFERIGILGTSLGSCLAMLTMAHDDRIVAGAFNHVSPYFADVVWRGLSTRHVRASIEGHLSADELRRVWMPISPWPYISRVAGRRLLLVHASYDQTFPPDLSRTFIAEFRRQGISHETALLPCGHYTTGKAPFKYLDGFYLTRFLTKALAV